MGRIHVQVKPRSSKEGVSVDDATNAITVRVRAAPVDGAANERVIEVLAKALGVRKSDITIARGETGRHKELEIAGLDGDAVLTRLRPKPDG